MQLGIRARIIFLISVPTILTALILATCLTMARIQDHKKSFSDWANSVTNQLAKACAFGMFSNNHNLLNTLARLVLQESDGVNNILIQDGNGHVVVNLNKEKPELAFSSHSSLHVEAPIYRELLDSNADPALPNVIGKVNLEFSPVGSLNSEQEIIKFSLLLGGFCLLLAGFLGQHASNKIAGPFLRLANALRELRINRPDIAHYDSSSTRFDHVEGDINIMISALRTSHQHLQEQINEATAELRETLEELEIKNAELDIARKRAIQASRVKSEFLANMSHEIRTPMNGVMGFISLLYKTKLNHTQLGYLRTLRASAENLMVILNDILDFSKIEAGKFKIRQRNFELRETLENAVMLFAANAHYKGLRLILDIEPDVPSDLVGDASRIAQIVTNFVSNAVKFTDQGEVEVLVRKTRESPSDVILSLLIRDTGIGIEPADQKHLFNAFYQLDSSTTRRHSGTGLGLAICHRLVSMMNGTLNVQSLPGKGSTFSITIKLAKQALTNPLPAKLQPSSNRAVVVSVDTLLNRAITHILEYGAIKPHCVPHFKAAVDYLGKALEENDTLPSIILDDSSIDTVSEPLIAQLNESLYGSFKLILIGINENHPKARYFSELFYTIHFANKLPTSRELLTLLDIRPGPIPQAEELNHCLDELDTTRPLFKKIKILLADDNLINRQLARIFLSQMGTQVDEAINGLEAIKACLSKCYDLILMDIHMPDMDGLEVTRRIRALENNPNQNAPIIALTADVMNQEPAYYLTVGMNDYLAKPITETALRQMIEKWRPSQNGIHLATPGVHSEISQLLNEHFA